MIASNAQQQDIQHLSNALEQLRLAQTNVNAVLERIRTREQSNQLVSQQTGERATERRRKTVHPLSSLYIGDKVRINKPREDQQNTGVVFGSTRSALVRVRTPNGQEVKRLTKNLILIQRYQHE